MAIAKTLTKLCNQIQSSGVFYKTDIFFVRREGNKKTVLFVHRSLPGMNLRVVNEEDVEIEVTYTKPIPPEKIYTMRPDKALCYTFAKLSKVRIATLFDYGFEFVCDGGLELYGVEKQYLQDDSCAALMDMCGQTIKGLPLKKEVSKDVVLNWVRPDSDSFLERLRAKQRRKSPDSLRVGQPIKRFDLTQSDIL